VILSEDSANSITGETIEIYSAMALGEKVKKAAVVHTPKGSFVSSEGQEHMTPSEYIDDMKLDVLGAGDAFAARFIYDTAKNPASVKENTASAHKFATNFVKGKK
jgi:sugar/nucleoside kinase (ribokinase family)